VCNEMPKRLDGMKSTLLVAVMCVLLGACDDRTVTTARSPIQGVLATPPPDAGSVAQRCGQVNAPFFSGTMLSSQEDWYGGQLRAMGETQLCEGGGDHVGTTFRLTWIPSFHPSVTVRVITAPDGYRLIGKILNGAGGYEPGSVAHETTIALSVGDVSILTQRFAEARFWELPTIPAPDSTIGLDGAQWILEGLSAGRYHVVDRWSPEPAGPDGAFRHLAEWLLERSGLVPSSLVKEY